MPVIHVHDKQFQPYISQDQIAGKIQEIAFASEKDYSGKTPSFIAFLNGTFICSSDLFKSLKTPS